MKMLNIPYNNYKTQRCKYFDQEGSCKFGKNCSYAHGDFEVRNPYDFINEQQLPPNYMFPPGMMLPDQMDPAFAMSMGMMDPSQEKYLDKGFLTGSTQDTTISSGSSQNPSATKGGPAPDFFEPRILLNTQTPTTITSMMQCQQFLMTGNVEGCY